MFAYGQTGSGKSYTMLGFKADPGVIPRIGEAIFDRIDTNTSPLLKFNLTISYYEIYNEKVRDLLNLKNKDNLKVREHPLRGPYVEDLSTLAINTYAEMQTLLMEGNKTRTVAATNMNQSSSRSHAVFTITLTQTSFAEDNSPVSERVSRIHLVDLAGSERVRMSGTSGARLKEGAEINKSLTTLGRVITTLVEKASHPNRRIAVPYRESTLTWLLKDALGGNSMTAMIATISPSATNYDQTLSTLRFANSVKKITNHAIVNEDPNAKLVRELKEELGLLRRQLTNNNQRTVDQSVTERQELLEKLSVSEKLLQEVNQTWEQKLTETEQIQKQAASALEDLGINIEDGFIGLHTPRKVPFLVNLSDDPMLTECLVYNIRLGFTLVGHVKNSSAEIRLSGSHILFEHCNFVNLAGTVTITPYKSASVIVNGESISQPQELHTGYRIILGHSHVFRFNNPLEKRQPAPKGHQKSSSLAVTSIDTSTIFDMPPRPTTPTPRSSSSGSSSSPPSDADWSYAVNEAVTYMGQDGVGLDSLGDDDLLHLYSQVLKVKNARASRPDSGLGLRSDLSPSPLGFNIDRSSPPPRRSRLSIGDGSLFMNSLEISPSRKSRSRRGSSGAFLMSGNASPRRLSLVAPPELSFPLSMPFRPTALFTERERLIKVYTDKWRSHTLVKEINMLLSYLPLIRKAQRYSDYFDLQLKFQLMVADHIQLSPYEHFNFPTIDEGSPICVRVMNFDRDIVHITSPQYLLATLPQTERFEILRKPQSPLPFVSNHFTLFGIAEDLQCAMGTFKADIISPYTYSTIGVAKLQVSQVTTAPLSALKQNAIAVNTNIATLELSGPFSEEVIDLHATVYVEGDANPLLVTPIIHIEKDGPVKFPSYFHVELEDTKSFRILVYASVRDTFLDRLVSWDEMQEPGLDSLFPKPATPIVLFEDTHLPHSHEMESNYFVENLATAKSREFDNHRSYVAVYLQILELNEHGAYTSVDVVDEVGSCLPAYSFLHQGLQRRIEITLLTGDGFFTEIESEPEMKIKVGEFRMVDSQGMIVEEIYPEAGHMFGESTFVGLKKVSTVRKITNSGFNGFTVTCQWPSTTSLLDRITPDANRLLFTVSVGVGPGTDKISFKCPISAAVRSRLTAGVSRWELLFGQVGITNLHMQWFTARNGYHRVPKTSRDFEALLGGLSSSDEFGHISQRGVSLLGEYFQFKSRIEVARRVQKARIKENDLGEADIESTEDDRIALLQECIDLWKTKAPTNLDIVSL